MINDRLITVSGNTFALNVLRLIHMALAIVVIGFMNYGFFSYALPYVPYHFRYGLYMIWIIIALVINKRFINSFIIQAWPLILFQFYIIFIFLFLHTDLMQYVKSISYLIMVYSIFLYYFNAKYIRFQKFLCIFLILDCIAVGINTYIQLQINPMIVRYLGTTPEIIQMVLGEDHFAGIGSYGYFYALVSVILLLVFLFLNQRKKKYLIFIIIVVAIRLLIQSSYTIAIIFTFIFISLLFIIRYANKYTVVFIAVIGIISILVFQGAFAWLFSQLADIEAIPYEVSARFNELADYFSGEDVSGTDLASRKRLYSQSIDAFTNNILMGTAVIHSSVYKAGGHSAWFDLLATFGLFCTPFFIFLYKAYKYCKNRVPIMFKKFLNVYWLYFVSLGFINTLLFAPIYTIWFLFLPVFISAFFKEEKLNIQKEKII